MESAPKVGDRIKVQEGHRYYPCTGTVTNIYPRRVVLNEDELLADDFATPRMGGLRPQREWAVAMRVDSLPKHWAYGSHDVFCPDVQEIELA